MIRYRRMRLTRDDGRVYLDRWGFQLVRTGGPTGYERDAWGGIFLHVMRAPDPGIDLHDHPWTFVTVPVLGSYTEERAPIRTAARFAYHAATWPTTCTRGVLGKVSTWRPRMMRLDECHRIVGLSTRLVVTVVLHGPVRRRWGFYEANGFTDQVLYDSTVSRPLANDMSVET